MLSLGKKIMIFDGGMGSELVKTGIDYSIPEDLNVTNPDVIIAIHKSYSDADFITTNTFGLNKYKYKGSYERAFVAKCAIENAKAVGKHVFFDIGPTGMLLKPMGTLDFDDAYEAFKEIVLCSSDLVDGYIVETFSDLYELKAAVLAIKENSSKPVFATMTFDKTGRTLTGTTPEIMVAFLENMGVDALGVNCSLGPNDLYDIIDRILKCSHTPVIIQPNRGLPKLVNGVAVYDLTVEEFTESVEKYTKMGVSVVGGCCGTSPSFISSIAKFKGANVMAVDNPATNVISSYSKLVEITDNTVFASLAIDSALSADDCEDIAYDVLDMVEDGADVINIESNDIAPDILKLLLKKIQELSSVPLQIITSNNDLKMTFERYYNGIPN